MTLKNRLDEGGVTLIDVREPNECEREHIEGAKLVPLSRFPPEDFADLRDKTAVFHCHSGGRTTANAQLLTSKGFHEAYQLRGGMRRVVSAADDEAGAGGRRPAWVAIERASTSCDTSSATARTAAATMRFGAVLGLLFASYV
jgi:rhodanese-related sulfurtransferase